MAVSNFVESVEFIELSVGATNLTVSGSLTKGQNYQNCIPFFTSASASGYGDSKLFDVYFSGTTSSGFVNFERANQRSNTATIMCYVVEFNPEEVRVQQGTFDVTSAYTHTVSLATTLSGTERAAMTFGWKSASTTNIDYSYHTVRGIVNSTSNLTFYRTVTGSSCTGHWFLFEDLNDNFRVTHISSASSAVTDPKTIDATRAIDPLRTFLLGSYACATTTISQPQRQTCRIRLYSNSSIFYNRFSSVSITVYWSVQVFEFLDTSKVYTPFFIENPSLTTNLTLSADSELPFTVDTDTSSIAASMMQGISYSESSSTLAFQGIFTASKVYNGNSVYLEKSSDGYAVRAYTPTVVDWAGIAIDTGSNTNIIPEGNGVGQSFIKSVENFRFELNTTIGARVLTKGQNWENCIIFASFFGSNSSSGYLNDCMVQVYIDSPGIVCFRDWSNVKKYIDVSVVEFWPDQVKVQRGEILLQNYTDETTIEEISSLNKSFIVSSVFSPNESYLNNNSLIRTRIKNTTTVEFYRYGVIDGTNVSYFVVEDLQDNFYTEHSTGSFSTYSIFYSPTVWGPHNSFIVASYANDSVSTYINRTFSYIGYDNVHAPIYLSKTSATSTTNWAATVVKFLDGRVHTQQIPITFSASTTTSSGTGTYDSMFLDYPDALSCFNVSTLSTSSTDSSSYVGTHPVFASIRIFNYVLGTYEYVRQYNASHTTVAGFVLVNWVGVNYRADNNIPLAIPTKSLVRSIQHDFFYDSNHTYRVFLTEGQKIKQCVPFICSGASASDGLLTRVYRNVFRFDDGEMFLVKYEDFASGNRHLSCYTVEFNDEIKIQTGSGYSMSTYIEFTIEEVKLNRAFLVFYGSANAYNTFGAGTLIAGKFVNSTTLRFERVTAYEAMYVTWYVVECPDDESYWYVRHYNATPPSSTALIPVSMLETIDINRSMLLTSYNIDSSSSYNSRSLWLTRFTNNDRILNFEKSSATASSQLYNIEIIEMPTSLYDMGFRAVSDLISITSSSGTDSLGLREPYYFDLNRSMVISSNADNGCFSQGTSLATWDEGYLYYYFVDGNTVCATKSRLMTILTTGSFFAYQWPEFNKYYMEGHVTELEAPVIRTVNAYRTSTGELVDSTTSVSGTGYFLLETPYPDEHYVVCLDDLANISYNHLVYGKIIPTVISGSFAYNNNLVTLSGLEVGVPLCYQ